MSAPIGPGDWVELVGPFRGDGRALAAEYAAVGWRVVGAYYPGLITVCEAVAPAMRLAGGRVVPGLRVRAVKVFRGEREGWLPAFQWRPVYRPKQSLIESLKQPAPDAVRELEDA